MEIVTRKEARECGLDRYFTGKPCIHGHSCERTTKTKICVQCNRDRVLRWSRNNPEKVAARRKRDAKMMAESAKRSKLKNPEKYKALRISWLQRNKIQFDASVKAAKQKNPEKYRALHRTWSANNKDKVAANSRVQGAKRRGASGRFTKRDIETILKAQRGKCAYFKICGMRLPRGAVYHVDHILAIARGGTNDPSNVQVLCPDCNMKKGARDAIVFVQRHGMLI